MMKSNRTKCSTASNDNTECVEENFNIQNFVFTEFGSIIRKRSKVSQHLFTHLTNIQVILESEHITVISRIKI